MTKNYLKLKNNSDILQRQDIRDRLLFAASNEVNTIYDMLDTGIHGLTEEALDNAIDKYGKNIVTRGKKKSLPRRIISAFVNPFTVILLILAGVSAFTDIILAPSGDKKISTVLIITVMVFISGILRFVQEKRSGNAAAKLSEMIQTTTCVERAETGKIEILLSDVTVGDIVHLSAGDLIPADMRIVFVKDLFVSQSALTGESEPVEKISRKGSNAALLDSENLAFMGSTVISGSAKGVVVATGDDTQLGGMSKALSGKPPKTSFERGVNSVSAVLIRFMLIMVPVVLFLNGFTKGDWMHASLFAISIAVGLTPEMLPMLVTTCLARGAVAMSHEQVIIKNMNSIQSLGSMDILCTDKTGTLTMDKVVLEYHLNIHGNEDVRVLRHAFLNSYYQTGLKNLMDVAIINCTRDSVNREPMLNNIETAYTKVDEIPFDFERRRMSVVVADANGKTQMITKGAVEEMISVSSFAEYNGIVTPLTNEVKEVIYKKAAELNESGMRVIAVAQKTNPSPVGAFSKNDEHDMVLIGYLAFLDPPKDSAAKAISDLNDYGVAVKVLTGDNDRVTRLVCRKVGIAADTVLTGEQIELISDNELRQAAEKVNVFAKLSPEQKARIVRALRDNGHRVGYMGDGINDALAMKSSDIGISVDTAVDIAKESADVILLKKDLTVLIKGIIEGRKTYANMIKYIKMTAQSNFGNMLSVLAAGAFLPFLPMESIHLLMLNLIYDISCIAIPWDNVDKEYLVLPRNWDASSVGKFMLWMGPVSSIFDITTYLLMYFIICPLVCGGYFRELSDPSARLLFISTFQAGWFVESMWSQTLVIHMIRTPKLPFIQSRASKPVTLLTFAGIALLTSIPFTPVADFVGLSPLPPVYFACLAAIVLGYMCLATAMKKLYIRRNGELL